MASPASIVLPPLLRANTLYAMLNTQTPNKVIKLLDGSWHLPSQARDPYAEFMQHHIPDAQFFGIDTIKDDTSPLPHMLPPGPHFAAAMDAFRIAPADPVVVYDACSSGMRSACRVWWTLRVFGHPHVAVLDGGLAAWRKAGYPVVSAQQAAQAEGASKAGGAAGTGSAWGFRKELVKSMKEMQENLKKKTFQVVDARPAGRFSGRDPEPRQGLPSGHIPGSLSLPASTLLDADGLFKPVPALRALLRGAGVDPRRPVVATCGSGITATMLAFALHLVEHASGGAGDRGVCAVYDGAWTEWASRGGKVALG